MKRAWFLGLLALLPWVGAAAKGPVVDPGANPLVPLWRDPQWLQGFLNYDPALAPKLTAEEQAFYQSLAKDQALSTQPLEQAARLESKIGPSSSALLSYVVANLYLREGDTTNAVRHLEAAVGKNDRFIKAHRNLGLVLARDGQFDKAVPHLTRTVALGGADGLTLGLLGYSLLNLQNTLSAQLAYQQAVLLEPENVDWRLGLIKCYVSLGSHALAVDLLDELIEKHPDREPLWALQANVFVQLGQPQKAIVNLEALRRMKKANSQNLGLLADLYMAQDDRDLALPIYLAMADQEAGGDPSRTIRAAGILTARGAWAEAQALIEKAREVFGSALGDEEAMALLKLEARVAMGSGAGETGIASLEEALLKNPLDGEALLLAGDYYAANGAPERAEIRYARAAQLEAFSADAWVKQAQLLVRGRKYVEALEFLRKAQKLRPRENIQTFLERVQVAAERAGSS